MQKLMIGSIVMYMLLIVVGYAQMIVPDAQNYILNENDQQVLDTTNINDPLRDGAYHVVNPEGGVGALEGITSSDTKIGSFEKAQNKTLNLIKNIINYALGMLGLVALIYLIYHGFLIVTATGDETQYKKGIKGVKFAAIAIVGIGVSWLIVSGIFWLLNLIIGS